MTDGVVEFRLALPIVHINCLGKIVEFGEGRWLAHTQNLVFDLVWEAIVENALKSTFSIASDLTCQAVELNCILIDPLSSFHGQISEFVLCVSDWIMRTNICLEF